MKKKLILIQLLLIISTSLLRSEYIQDHFKFVKQGFCTEVKDRKTKDFPYLIKCKSDGVWGLRKETVKLGDKHYFVLKNFLTEKFKYIGPVTSVDKINGFDFNNNLLFITFGSKHYQFFFNDFNSTDTIDITSHNVVKSHSYINNNDIDIKNNIVFLHRSYPGELLNGSTSTTYIQKINTNGKISNYYNFPIPKGEYFGITQPSNTLTVSNKFIAQSNRTEYKINFYDYNYKKVDSIVKSWPTPNRISDEDMKNFELKNNLKTTQMSIIINHLHTEFWDKLCNHIRTISFLNDSLLLVFYSAPTLDSVVSMHTRSNVVFDIWIFNENKWSIYKESLSDCNGYKKGKINKTCQEYFTHYEAGVNMFLLNHIFHLCLKTKLV